MVKRKLTKWFLTAISICIGTIVTAAVAVASEDEPFAAAKSRLEAGLSAMVGSAITIDRVSPTESDDLIEVTIVDGPVLYATRDGDFLLLNGDLLKVTSSSISNLTEERRISDRLSLIGDLDTNDMIVFSPLEPPKAHITVFTDITCGFCRKLHLEMDDFNRRGIEVRYLAKYLTSIPRRLKSSISRCNLRQKPHVISVKTVMCALGGSRGEKTIMSFVSKSPISERRSEIRRSSVRLEIDDDVTFSKSPLSKRKSPSRVA